MEKENISIENKDIENKSTETTNESNSTKPDKSGTIISIICLAFATVLVFASFKSGLGLGMELTPEEAKEYAIQMADINNMSTSASTVKDKDLFVINTNNSDYTVQTLVNIDEMHEYFTNNMRQVDQEYGICSLNTLYQDDTRSVQVQDFDDRSVIMYYHPNDTSIADPYLVIKVDNNNKVTNMSLEHYGILDNDLSSDLTVDNLNLESNLQDVLDTYGLPTDTLWRRVDGRSKYEIVYSWYLKDMDLDMSITFQVMSTLKGEPYLKMKEFNVETAQKRVEA